VSNGPDRYIVPQGRPLTRCTIKSARLGFPGRALLVDL